MKKAVVAAVVVIVLVLAGAWYFTEPKPEAPVVANTQASQPQPADTTAQPSAPAVTAQNSSDAAIGQDMAGVDANMKALDADSANADSGINDQPVSQQ